MRAADHGHPINSAPTDTSTSELDRAGNVSLGVELYEAPEAISDLLIVLDSDGRSHTAQHTIASNGPAITLKLPGSVVPQEVLIFGTDQQRQRTQYKKNPADLILRNGTAFVRYQHQYGDEVQPIQLGHFVLTTSSVPASLDTLLLSRSATTWVFPSEYELISYTVTDENIGHWVIVDNTLTFHQLSNESVELSINYRKKIAQQLSSVASCPEGKVNNDNCSDDQDEDGIPDYRDVCKSVLGRSNNEFGCDRTKSMLLDAVDFNTGRAYLDVSARAVLNRLAFALSKHNEHYVEIGAHTDNAGQASSNLQLSQKRADAVRHYLILKGVNPNAIRAAGYGEQYPIRDNSTADGRLANRRVELTVINQ